MSVAMPITMIRAGETGSIKRIVGNDDTMRRLEHMGFVLGEEVTVVTEMAGNLIVSVKDTRVALSKSLANKIIV